MNRSTAYYVPKEPPAEEVNLIRRIDEIHLRYPFYGSQRIRDELQDQEYTVNRKRIQRLIRVTGIEALHPKPTTSRETKPITCTRTCYGA